MFKMIIIAASLVHFSAFAENTPAEKEMIAAAKNKIIQALDLDHLSQRKLLSEMDLNPNLYYYINDNAFTARSLTRTFGRSCIFKSFRGTTELTKFLAQEINFNQLLVPILENCYEITLN